MSPLKGSNEGFFQSFLIKSEAPSEEMICEIYGINDQAILQLLEGKIAKIHELDFILLLRRRICYSSLKLKAQS